MGSLILNAGNMDKGPGLKVLFLYENKLYHPYPQLIF